MWLKPQLSHTEVVDFICSVGILHSSQGKPFVTCLATKLGFWHCGHVDDNRLARSSAARLIITWRCGLYMALRSGVIVPVLGVFSVYKAISASMLSPL